MHPRTHYIKQPELCILLYATYAGVTCTEYGVTALHPLSDVSHMQHCVPVCHGMLHEGFGAMS